MLVHFIFFFEEEEENNNKIKMGPTVIDTNPATVSSSSFLTTGIWTKLQGKERFPNLFFHGSGLAEIFLLISKEVFLPGTKFFI